MTSTAGCLNLMRSTYSSYLVIKLFYAIPLCIQHPPLFVVHFYSLPFLSFILACPCACFSQYLVSWKSLRLFPFSGFLYVFTVAQPFCAIFAVLWNSSSANYFPLPLTFNFSHSLRCLWASSDSHTVSYIFLWMLLTTASCTGSRAPQFFRCSTRSKPLYVCHTHCIILRD